MEEELVVSLMVVLLVFHLLNLICNSISIEGGLVRAGSQLLEKRLILAGYRLESLKE
jgi:hypothetical protein